MSKKFKELLPSLRAVVLLEEFEKAHQVVENFLLTVLQEGQVTLNTSKSGEPVDLSKVVFILTSNIGSRDMSRSSLGFVKKENRKEQQVEDDIYNIVKHAAERQFQTEFMGRIKKNIIAFRPLEEKEFRQILDNLLAEVKRLGERKSIGIDFSEKIKDFLILKGTSDEYGARPLEDTIEKHITDLLAFALESGKVKEGEKIVFDFDSKPIIKTL